MSDHIHKCPRTSHLLQSRFESIGSSHECTTTGIWHVTYNADNKRAQSPSRSRGATAILRLARGLTSARARSGIPRHSGNCYRPILFSNATTVVEMGYDYTGRRFEYKETVNNTLTRHERYLYRGYLQIVALDLRTQSGNNAIRHCIIWDPTETTATRPLALIIGTVAYYYSFDQAKNVTELFDSNGALAATYAYSPFGQLVSSTGAISNPLTFSSEIHDSTLGIQYYNYRHLNVLDGRWVNRDPIGESGWWTLYKIKALEKFHQKTIKVVTEKLAPYSYIFLSNVVEGHYDFLGLIGTCVCPSGSNCGKRRPKGFIGEANGCGPEAGLGKGLVPNDPMSILPPFISCPFTESCNYHDLCYSDCNSGKSNCDYNFYQAMQGACITCYENNFKSWDPRGWIFLGDCAAFAALYYGAVSEFGEEPYKRGQKEGCEPCCCPIK